METMEKKQASLALDTACELLRGVLDTFTDQFPFSCSENNFYPAGPRKHVNRRGFLKYITKGTKLPDVAGHGGSVAGTH